MTPISKPDSFYPNHIEFRSVYKNTEKCQAPPYIHNLRVFGGLEESKGFSPAPFITIRDQVI
jgi:hypothetical protein